MPPTARDPNLIECFKRNAPDHKLYCDEAQLRAKEGKLFRWTDREAFKAGKIGREKAHAPKGKKAEADEGTDQGQGATPPANPTADEKAAIEAAHKLRETTLDEAEQLGIPTTAKMTTEQIRHQIEKKKKSGK